MTYANKVSLKVAKMKHYKKLEFPRKIRLWRKRLYHSKSVKYRGVRIGENLNWKDDIATKLTANYCSMKLKIMFKYFESNLLCNP